MGSRHHDERGDTLVEVLFALVIIALVVTALFSSFTTASRASTGNKNLVTADAILRNTAEATKAAVRTSCVASPTFAAPSTGLPGFTVALSTTQCPASVTATRQVDITVTLPGGTTTKTLSILVRTP